MAPPKTPRRQTSNVSPLKNGSPAMGTPNAALNQQVKSPSASQPTDGYTQAQEEEIEVLKSIYMEDFEEVESRGAWSKTTDRALRLKLKALSSDETWVILTAKLTATYPKSLPTLSLEGLGRLRQKTKNRLEKLLVTRPKEIVGEVMIYDIASTIQEILEDDLTIRENDGAFENLEAERAVQEAATAELAKKHEEELQKKREEEKAEEERALQQMVHDEMRRKEQMAKRKHRASGHTPTSYFPQGNTCNQVSFDRIINFQDDGKEMEFTAVDGLIPFRSGSVTETLLVKPARSDQCLTMVLKRMRTSSIDPAAEIQLKKAIVEFEKEMEDIKRLRQSAIMSVYDFKIEHIAGGGWEINVLTEYAGKGSLGEKLEDDGDIAVGKVRSWTIELLEALDYYHRNGVIHKRIHPHNILLQKAPTGNITVKLADAGFQQSLHNLNALGRGEQAFTTSRTAFWVPAELTQDARRTRKTDVWDLGVVFLQMLFGLDVPQKYNSPKDLSDALGCSEALQEILRKFFKPDPKKRPSPFELIPCEFLRDDVSVYEHPSTPGRSRHSSISWTPHHRLRRESSNGAVPSTRYASEWVEIGRLGKGGYGEVVKARNRFDGSIYAIKKIRQKSASALTEVLSEVMLLSRLNHPCVVRYYGAFLDEEGPGTLDAEDDTSTTFTEGDSNSGSEASDGGSGDEPAWSRSTGGLDFISSSHPRIQFGSDEESFNGDEDAIVFGSDSEDDAQSTSTRSLIAKKRTASSSIPSRPVKTILYIQMEFCEKQTLRDVIRRDLYEDPDEAWRLFRQILEGLAHIHGHGIIHRDLKPDNIFIDVAKTPKIGDFGLATIGQYQSTDRKVAGSQADGGDMTRSVGTALYVAPELRSGVAGNYTDKVDMYSLGIIFFEMCHPLKTAMERDFVIRQLRERKHDLPEDLNSPEKAAQGSLITSLISHRPSERPGCEELLRSGKVPVQIEDNAVKEALKALSDRNSPHYAKMLAALFSQKPDTQAKDFTWDIATSTGTQDIKPNDILLQSLVKERLTAVFRGHGAVESQRPLLLPWSEHYTNKNVVKLFDPSGTLVQLPFDLTLPFARSIGRGAPYIEKTFTISSVYRDSYTGGAPRSNGEADFDILSEDTLDLALKEAEVLKVIDEVIDEFPPLSSTQMCFHLNHTELLEIVMDFCRIDSLQRPAVKEILSKLNIQKYNWQKIKNELRGPDVGVSSTSLDDLARFDWRDTPEKAFAKLRRIFVGTRYLDRTHAIFAHLSSVVNYMKHWNIKRKVYINVLSSFNEKFYKGGVLFQCLFDGKQREVLAAGGRYDRLIEEYRPKAQGRGQQIARYHGVGMNLGWDRLVNAMVRYLKKPDKTTFLKKHTEEDTSAVSWMPRRCDCLVASFDSAVLRSTGVKMAAGLISHGFTAELSIDAHSIEDVLRHYRDDRHSWIIVIKHGIAPDKPDLKVKSIAKKEDTDLRSADLLNYLRNELRDRDAREGTAAQRNTKAISTTPTATVASKANVDVLISHHRSKKSSKWSIVETAQARSTELLSSFQGAPIAAFEAKDEIMNLIRETRLGDPETWRRAIQSVPLAERKYLQELHDLLRRYAARWKDEAEAGNVRSGEGGKAFVYNFRTGGCLLYDLET
ncbi:kinase-like protein [Aaosphaeria arxii CBS 175.79]|uniref:non-specific serine/threonine protein kinase n=1 Tax=Aaosphaeria arxii CBS 175.79 TaxID=1450172 RepID=A0A6A5X757_9PLEO|nr:kinase-like protein [Aaosphaeria arxii CBS 175.79]KAF2008855.1 kinase-like protein [Aaosphaeria arxii CBS 175.79]